jgi:serine/threonine protein kinase
VHRDVKPDNVFMAGDSAMLGDFGLAVACGDAADAQGSGSMHTDTAAAAGATNAISCAQLSAPLLQRLAVRARRGSDSSNCSSAVLTPTSASSAGSADLDAVLVLPKGSSCNDSGSGVGGAAPAGRRVSSLDSCKAVSAAMAAGSAHAGGTPAYVAPEVVQAAFNQVTLAEVLAPQVGTAVGLRSPPRASMRRWPAAAPRRAWPGRSHPPPPPAPACCPAVPLQNDVWSLGVLVLECLSGRHPFGGPCVPAGQVLAAISSSKCLQLSCLPVSPQCRDWLAAALARDPRQRWSVAQLLQHPWLHEQLPPPPHGQQGAGPAAAAAAAAGAACVPGGAASVDGGDAVACRDHSTKRRQGGWSAAAGAVSQLASDDGCGCAAGDATPAAAAAAAAAETASSGSAALLQRCGLGGITSWED